MKKRLIKILGGFIRDWKGYILAVVLVAAASGIKFLAAPNIIPSDVPITYMLAIVPIALFFGLGPSILVCLLSMVAYGYFFLDSTGRTTFDITTVPILIIFLFVGVTFSILSSNLRRRNLQAEQEIVNRKKIEKELITYQEQLEDKVGERTSALEYANQSLQDEIAERVNVQVDLQQEKDYVQQILDTARTIILTLDMEGRILYFNSYMENISGYQLSEVAGKDWFEVFLPKREQQVTRNVFQDVIDKIPTLGHINPIVTKDGRELFIEWFNTSLNKDDRVNGVLACGQDITEHLKIEQELRHARQQVEIERRHLEAIVAAIPAAVVVIEADTLKLSLINRRGLELYGRDFVGAGLNDHLEQVKLLDPAGRPIPQEKLPVIRSIKHGEQIFNEEMSLTQSDGTRIPVIASSTPLFDSSGKVTAAILVFDDISRRKRAEDAVLKEKDRAKQYWELAGTMLLALGGDGTVIDINRKGCEIIGYRKNEIIGKIWFDNFLPPGNRENMRSLFFQIIAGDNGLFKPSGEFTILTINGERRISWHHSLVRDEKGKITGVISSGEDITERQKIEEELQKIEKLESLGTLAGGIAHDFNNILTAILGNISFAMAASKNPEVSSALGEAEKASMRARELTQQLLTFSRGGAPIKKTIALPGLIKESSSFALHGSNTKSEFFNDKELWAVQADEGQINQVIHNLAKNAVEAMPDGGVVRISAFNKIINEDCPLPLKPGHYVQIDVADSGIGIKQENLAHMFEPFFTTKTRGSGLGLATSFSIIKNHGGYMTVESEMGKGSTFHVFLPATELPVEEKKGPLTHHVIHGRGNILVMDDEEMIRNMLASILKAAGYHSVLTADGEDAIKKYSRALKAGKPFDAVIMDLTIPGGMGGKEAIRTLKEKDPAVKVIVSSGYANDPIMAEYEKFGFSAVVTKPYTAEKIEKTLHDLLNPKKMPTKKGAALPGKPLL